MSLTTEQLNYFHNRVQQLRCDILQSKRRNFVNPLPSPSIIDMASALLSGAATINPHSDSNTIGPRELIWPEFEAKLAECDASNIRFQQSQTELGNVIDQIRDEVILGTCDPVIALRQIEKLGE
jgi:hypothetical protein